MTKFELELAQAEQAADAGRKAAGLRKFESCIVHQKPTAYLSCRFSFFFRYKDSKLVTKFELELAQAEQAADAGRKAAGLRKFESCIVHHS